MLKGSQVVYGPLEPEFKEALAFLKKMYAEGLIFSDYSSANDKAQDAKVTNNLAGSWNGSITGNMAKYMDVMKKDIKDVNIAGVPYIKGKDQKRYIFNVQTISPNNAWGAAISKSGKHISEAVAFLDYIYSDEGNMIMNFGIEGESYKMENGRPVYTDIIKKNPDGLSIGDALARYAPSIIDQPMIQDLGYITQMFIYPQQESAVESWIKEISPERTLPTLTYSSDEATEFNTVMGDVKTHTDEMLVKFIMGVEPLSKYDDYVKEIKNRRIEEALKTAQAAYERYLKRK
jgi:putative aldouronate transport system substrate-binding protein